MEITQLCWTGIWQSRTFGESHLKDEEKIYVSGCMSLELAAPVGKSVINGGGSESDLYLQS